MPSKAVKSLPPLQLLQNCSVHGHRACRKAVALSHSILATFIQP